MIPSQPITCAKLQVLLRNQFPDVFDYALEWNDNTVIDISGFYLLLHLDCIYDPYHTKIKSSSKYQESFQKNMLNYIKTLDLEVNITAVEIVWMK